MRGRLNDVLIDGAEVDEPAIRIGLLAERHDYETAELFRGGHSGHP